MKNSSEVYPVYVSVPELIKYLSTIDTSVYTHKSIATFYTPGEREEWLSHATVAGLRIFGLYEQANELFEDGKQELIEQGEDPDRWGQVGLYYGPENKGEQDGKD